MPVIHDAERSVPGVRRRLRRARRRRARQRAAARRLPGANVTLTNPGGIGTVASVPRLMPGQGTIVATGAIAPPARVRQGRPAQARRPGRREGHDDDLDLRPPGHPGRESGAVPEARSTSCCRATTASTTASSPRSAVGAAGGRPGPPSRPTVTAARPGPAPWPRRPSPTVPGRGADAGRPGGDLDHQGAPRPRPPRGATSTARLAAARRPRARAGDGQPDARADARGSRRRCCASRCPARRSPTRCPAARDLHRHDRLRGRAHPGHNRRVWLREKIESGAHRAALDPEQKRGCSSGCRRSRRSRATCTRRSSARSGSRSRASTSWCRCSTR